MKNEVSLFRVNKDFLYDLPYNQSKTGKQGGNEMVFQDILEMWLSEKKKYVKESTYAYYSFEVQNYIMPMLGNKAIHEITEEYIQGIVLHWQKEGMENGHPLKKSTVQNLVVLLKQVLRYAAKKKIIENGMLEIHFAPETESKKIQVFSKEEQNRLIQAILDELSYRTFGILLCINSGMRIGELCALKWSDIDLRRRIIHIDKTLQRIYIQNATPRTQIIITSPKTATSIRDIPMSDKVFEIVSQLPNINREGYVLSNEKQYIEPRTFRKFYSNFLARHGIDIKHFHCLRHTFATRCIENGGDYKSVSEILGHTTINTTLNMYVHPQMEEKKKCVDMLKWN